MREIVGDHLETKKFGHEADSDIILPKAESSVQ
jgi:hypothetical protein